MKYRNAGATVGGVTGGVAASGGLYAETIEAYIRNLFRKMCNELFYFF